MEELTQTLERLPEEKVKIAQRVRIYFALRIFWKNMPSGGVCVGPNFSTGLLWLWCGQFVWLISRFEFFYLASYLLARIMKSA